MENIKNIIIKHKNLALFVALVIFVGITYWFEEKGNADKKLLEQNRYSILDVTEFGALKALRGIKLNFKKVGDIFVAGENNLDLAPKKVDEFFRILSGLKSKTSIPSKDVQKVGRSFYIPDETMKMKFEFENGNLEFVLGKKLDFDQAFYMEIIKNGEHQMFVVNDESPDPGAYTSEKEYNKSDAKYKRLEMMFLLTNVYFYETKIFKHQNYEENKINFKKIDISTFRNKKFQIDYEKTFTNPPIPKGLEYDEDNWVAFHKSLTNLEGKTIFYPVKESNLDEVLSRFEVTDRQGASYTLDVYKKYGSLQGYFLKSSLSKDILYELKYEDAMYFFVNVQDFWKRKIAPSSKEYEMKIVFHGNKGRMETIHISDKEIFNATAINKKLKILEVKKLLDFLKMPGDHVSELTKKTAKPQGNPVLDLYFENRHLGVMLEENDVVVTDFDNNFRLHHYVGKTIPFSYMAQDFFEN
jgi:hypothetical protein